MKKVLIPTLILLFGCAGAASLSTVTRDTVEIDNDPYSPFIVYRGITDFNRESDKNFGIYTNHFIRSFEDRETGELTHQVYVHTRYRGDWVFFNRASFLGGQSAPFSAISSDVINCGAGTCTLTEHFGIDLTTEHLKNHRNGINIQVSAQTGYDFIVALTANQINSQLNAIGIQDDSI